MCVGVITGRVFACEHVGRFLFAALSLFLTTAALSDYGIIGFWLRWWRWLLLHIFFRIVTHGDSCMEINDYNKNLVLDQKQKLLDSLRDANKHLENKASGLVQTGGFVLGLIATFGLVGTPRSGAAIGALVSAFLFFALALVALLWSLYPKGREYPGTSDWDATFEKYLYVDANECFEQVLSNILSATKNGEAANKEKSDLVIIIGGLFVLQLIALLAFVVMG